MFASTGLILLFYPAFFFPVFIDMEVSCVSPSESICFLINFIAFRQKFPQSLEQNRILKNLLCKQFLPFTRVSCRKVPLCLTWLPAIFEKNFNQAIRKLFNWYSYPKNIFASTSNGLTPPLTASLSFPKKFLRGLLLAITLLGSLFCKFFISSALCRIV